MATLTRPSVVQVLKIEKTYIDCQEFISILSHEYFKYLPGNVIPSSRGQNQGAFSFLFYKLWLERSIWSCSRHLKTPVKLFHPSSQPTPVNTQNWLFLRKTVNDRWNRDLSRLPKQTRSQFNTILSKQAVIHWILHKMQSCQDVLRM